MSQASLERQLAAAQAAKLELESKLREKELVVERLEGDRRWLAEREKEEREEKERERDEHLEYKVRRSSPATIGAPHAYHFSAAERGRRAQDITRIAADTTRTTSTLR